MPRTSFKTQQPTRSVSEGDSILKRSMFHFSQCLILGVVALIGLIFSAIGCHKTDAALAKETEAAAPVEAAPISVSVALAESRAVQRRVAVVGTLYGFERIVVTPKVEGRVTATHFDVGDRVSPQATLLELDATDYELAVDEAQRALEQELSRLDLTKPPVGEFDIEQLPSVERARLVFENAKREFERQRTLLKSNAAAKQTYEQTENDQQIAASAFKQARLDARTTLATVRHREAVLSVARQKLSETTVKAPTLGGNATAHQLTEFVVAKRMASVGEMVRAFPSTPVFELVVDDVLKLHIMVPERYLSQVRVGLDTEVRVEAYPRETFLGKIARINPTVDTPSRSFDVEVQIDNRDHRLKHGGFAKAEVIVGTDSDAVTIPLEAVTRFAGVSKVFRVRDDRVEEVEIQIGTQGPGWLEALGGLHTGDVVVTSGQSRLGNGSRVNVRTNSAVTANPTTVK